MSIEEKQARELAFWRNSPAEKPTSESVENVISKVADAEILLDCLRRYASELRLTGRILELGAGQGWASCFVKRLHPDAIVVATDISPDAVASVNKWEHIWKVKIDRAYAAKGYATEEADASVDLIFCYAAAHHFVAHAQTLREMARILKPTGAACWFYEPTSPKVLYPLAYRRVIKKRSSVPEDVLVPGDIVRMARQAGLNCRVDYYPSLVKRGPVETVYYFVLRRLTFLQRMLPCTANFIFTKDQSSGSQGA